ncbi:MAG: response regulator [Lachnospiraceae bacterium]|nr:response regulator [Robinsoniella sp.]MDY3767760.1 response regulator [Lachnospiraceae bacterium]
MNKKYTVGLVEDEIIERRALSLIISRNISELEVIFEAGDGKSALDLVHKTCPDILIVDIKIPEISGLDLCRTLRDEGYMGHMIISTSYSLFNYAYQAIKLNVFDYLLKPTEEEQILNVLRRCIDQLDQNQSAKEKEKKMIVHMSQAKYDADLRFVDHILAGDQHLLPRLYEIGFPQDGQWNAVWITLSLGNFHDMEEKERVALHASICGVFQEEFFIFARISQNNILIFLQPKKRYEISHFYAILRCYIWSVRQVTKPNHPCYVSPICGSLEETKAASFLIPSDLETLQLTSKDFISYILFDKAPHAFSKDKYTFHMCRMIRLIQDKKLRYLENMILTEIKECVGKERAKAWEYMRIFADALTSFSYTANLSILQQNITEESMVTDCVKLRDIVHRSLASCYQMPQETIEDSMTKILHIIQTEYASNLSQAEVAQRVGMTQTYFSRMFKNKIGKNFVSVLTEVRIKHAKELIRENREITLEELAALCGYTSKTYFCALFRKETGMTVSEYQKRREYGE